MFGFTPLSSDAFSTLGGTSVSVSLSGQSLTTTLSSVSTTAAANPPTLTGQSLTTTLSSVSTTAAATPPTSSNQSLTTTLSSVSTTAAANPPTLTGQSLTTTLRSVSTTAAANPPTLTGQSLTTTLRSASVTAGADYTAPSQALTLTEHSVEAMTINYVYPEGVHGSLALNSVSVNAEATIVFATGLNLHFIQNNLKFWNTVNTVTSTTWAPVNTQDSSSGFATIDTSQNPKTNWVKVPT